MKRVNSYLENNKWMLPLVILFIFLLSRLLMYLVFIVWQYVNNVDIFIFDRMNNWDAGCIKVLLRMDMRRLQVQMERGRLTGRSFH